MAAPVKPRKVQANGKDSWWFVPAVASTSAPTALEVNAATGINVSCTLLATFEGLSGTTNKVTLDRFLCETETFEANDNTSYSMADIVGGFDPQAAAGSDDKKAFEFFKDGFTGFAVRRQAVDATSGDATAGQFVDVVPVDVAPAIPSKTNTDASGIYSWSAAVSITGKPSFNVAVA